MNTEAQIEAHIIHNNNILLILSHIEHEHDNEHKHLIKDFCGITHIIEPDSLPSLPDLATKTVYLCGDLAIADHLALHKAQRLLIIDQLSYGDHEATPSWSTIDLGQVPLLIHGVGVYYRRFFDANIDYFKRIDEEHTFQSLTESTKPAKAHRTGIYLTPVKKDSDGLHFRLLRCSTNLSGATENFRANDQHLVDALNVAANGIFEHHAPLNHVLAQIYRNTRAKNGQKQTKARISSHADKTKDMPSNGIMAFCTFYDQLNKLQPLAKNAFDYGYKNRTGLTTLQFRLKTTAKQDPSCLLPDEFSITLYPNSVFFMPLSTNRLYTHAIKPSILDADMLPTRLGYVVRCSNTEAVHRDGHTFLKQHNKRIKMQPATQEGMAQLRKLYAQENKTTEFIDYGNDFLFSMNEGDYKAPEYAIEDEFRQYSIPSQQNLFAELLTSIRFETVGKGRQGAVLVKNDETRGVPIVRTTTHYQMPAQHFQSVHTALAQQIKKCASLPHTFNNALIENYTNRYTKMGFHSDQAQDLADHSSIAIFSCYQHPELKPSRKLIITSKQAEGGTFEIPLRHNSVVVFSLDTNRHFKHKIVLDHTINQAENQWLGITFRCSKTFVTYDNDRGQAYFEDGTLLTLADKEQSREFYSLRRRENKEIDFCYPWLTYTLSESDRIALYRESDNYVHQ